MPPATLIPPLNTPDHVTPASKEYSTDALTLALAPAEEAAVAKPVSVMLKVCAVIVPGGMDTLPQRAVALAELLPPELGLFTVFESLPATFDVAKPECVLGWTVVCPDVWLIGDGLDCVLANPST